MGIPRGYSRDDLINECWLHVGNFIERYRADYGMSLVDYVYHRSQLRMRDILGRWYRIQCQDSQSGCDPDTIGKEDCSVIDGVIRLAAATKHLSDSGKMAIQKLLSGDLDFAKRKNRKLLRIVKKELGIID